MGWMDKTKEWMTPERALAMQGLGMGLSQMDAGQPVNLSPVYEALDQRKQQAAMRKVLEVPGIMDKFTPEQQAVLASMPESLATQIIMEHAFKAKEAPRPIEVGGVLLDPVTYQPIFDSRTPAKPDTPNSVQEYEYYKQGAIARGETPMAYEEFLIADEKASVPPGAPNIGTIPQGYEAIQGPDGAWSMRPIPGGPEDKSVKDNLRKQNAMAATETASTAAKRALDAATNRKVDGVLGAVAAYNPESTNAELYRQTNALKAMASIESLTAMRNASPTGAGMGNPTDRDAVLLEQKHGALDPMSPNYPRDLLDYTRALFQTIHGKEAGDALFEEQFAEEIASVATGKTKPAASSGKTKNGLQWSVDE